MEISFNIIFPDQKRPAAPNTESVRIISGWLINTDLEHSPPKKDGQEGI